MKTKNKSAPQTMSALSVFFVFFGTIVGAGFASGREVYVYFARFGICGLLMTLLAGLLFYALGYIFLQLGKRCKVQSLSDFFKLIFGKFSPIIEIVVIFSYVIVLSAMFAGFDSLQHIIFSNLTYPIFTITSAFLCVLAVLGGINKISKLNGVLLPLLLVFMGAIFVHSLKIGNFNAVVHLGSGDFATMLYSFMCCLIFVCSNMFLTGFVLMKTGANTTPKIDRCASKMTALVLLVISFFACLSIIVNPESVQYDMPFVYLAFGISDAFVILSVIILWFAIFTTAIATMLTISWWLKSYINNFLYSTIITCVVAFLLSRVGFSVIIDICYPLTGLMDVVFVLCALYLFFNSKKKNNLDCAPKLANKKCTRVRTSLVQLSLKPENIQKKEVNVSKNKKMLKSFDIKFRNGYNKSKLSQNNVNISRELSTKKMINF